MGESWLSKVNYSITFRCQFHRRCIGRPCEARNLEYEIQNLAMAPASGGTEKGEHAYIFEIAVGYKCEHSRFSCSREDVQRKNMG